MGKAVIGAAFKPVYADILARGHGEYMLAGGRGSLKCFMCRKGGIKNGTSIVFGFG